MQNKKQDSPEKPSILTVIRRYYLNLFIGFILLFLVIPSSTDTPGPSSKNIPMRIGWALLLTIVCGTLYYLQNTKWGPARRKKILLKSPFTELFQNGFIQNGDAAIGNVNGYTVLIFYTWISRKSAIKMEILFGIDFHVYNHDEVLRDIIHRNPPRNRFSDTAEEWTRNSVYCRFEYYFRPPSYKKLKAKAEELTAILLRENLVPLSLKDAFQLGMQFG